MANKTSKSRPAAPSMTGDLNQELITPLQEFDTVAGLVSKDMVNELTPSIQTWARETTQSINAVQSAMQTFQVVAVDAFMETGDATVKAGIAAAIYGENTGKAMERAAKAALASIAEQAGVNALNALAQGLWFLRRPSFSAIQTRQPQRRRILKQRRNGARLLVWQAQQPPRCLVAAQAVAERPRPATAGAREVMAAALHKRAATALHLAQPAR